MHTNMKKNMGNTDRTIRLLVAAVLLALYFTDTITGTIGAFMVVLSIIFAATSVVSFCPLYVLVGLNTCPREK
jgi:hypothetical protein